MIADLGYRLTGSSDVFSGEARPPQASLNFVTVHDGFTLRDLVSLREEAQRGERRGQRGRRAGGHEPELRRRGRDGRRARASRAVGTLARSLMATLFVSQGVPMLEMGDELWRTQRGNNNAYCHDSELTWVDWRESDAARGMLAAARALVALRKRLAVLRQRDFLRGARMGDGRKDITWLRAGRRRDAARRLEGARAGDASRSVSREIRRSWS